MRSWRDLKSPWGRQLRFADSEFELMMAEFRERAGPNCYRPGKGIDVDLVLLRAAGTEADYVHLKPGILGRTLFDRNGAVRIEISRALAEAAEVDRVAWHRLRATIAHECGHVACHRCLFAWDTETIELFPGTERFGGDDKPPFMCHEEHVVRGRYDGKWWEYQANRCMGCLLLPKTLFSEAVRATLADAGQQTFQHAVKSGYANSVMRALADHFDVSLTVTMLRLQALGFMPANVEQRSFRLGA